MKETIYIKLNELSWNKIKWNDSYQFVRRIQKRIFKASLNDQRKKVHFLQNMLIQSPHAKLVAVQQVTTLKKGRSTPGIDGYVAVSSSDKMKMAENLKINGKANTIRRVWIPKPGKIEKRPLGIPTIQDRAKQALCKLALEPEWEAKFEPNSYGSRPGRRPHDAIEAIFLNLHHNKDKYVYDADILKCFERINHDLLIKKINTFPLFEKQLKSWLKAGILNELANEAKTSIPTMGTPQGGIISPLLSNIALNGLEFHLLNYVSNLKIKPNSKSETGKRVKRAALGFVRYVDDILIIHENEEIIKLLIQETKQWLSTIGLEISEDKSKLRKASQSFNYLGFNIILVKRHNKMRVKVTPSKKNRKDITEKISSVISRNKSASSYKLISKIRPILLGWGNYFKYCECSKTFQAIDNIIYQQIRAWVFRRAIRQGRKKVKDKYFPPGKTYVFQGRKHQANWILNGSTKDKKGEIRENHLPKLSWIKSEKHIKIKSIASVYDGNEIYWAMRTPIHSGYSTRIKTLLRTQKGKCRYCNELFTVQDTLEVDHIQPKARGGRTVYQNLQLLHRYCHVQKTRLTGKILQEPDEGKLSRPDLKTRGV
jgi:RNA-directed DNA polymerase